MYAAGRLMAGVVLLSTLVAQGAAAQTAVNWTGFYAGAHLGNAAARSNWKSGDGAFAGAEPFGGQFTGGGSISGLQFGYNYQFNYTVLGLEADASWADIDGAARCAIAMYVCNAKIDALGTITTRLGFAYDRFLVFGKAGAAWAHERLDMTPTPGLNIPNLYNGNKLAWGWTVGAGLEYAITPAISAKAEYNYLAFDSSIGVTDASGTAGNISLGQQVHLIKVGLNYKLGEKSPWENPFGAARTAGPVWNWGGLYAGLHAGGAWGSTDWKSADGPLAAFSTSTFPGSGTADGSLAGGQIGYNLQFGSWVAGVEVSASWANIDGYAKCATNEASASSYACHSRIDTLVTAAGRLGQSFGNFLVYGKGGFAWAKEKHDAYQSSGTVTFTGNSDRTGYMLGTGIEYAITPAWSAKVDYEYVDLGDKTVAMTDQAGNVSNILIGQQLHLVKFGLNYKFGADPFAMNPANANASLITKAPVMSTGWVMEAGTRYFFSNGKSQQDLYSNTTPGQLNSRLIYGDMNGHAAEGFVRLDHRSGVFVKGNFGIGSLVNGKLYDEDMPPDTSPYSNTLSDMHDGSMRYASLDLGYNVLNSAAGKLGPYVGYRYFYQRGRGFGCNQVANGNVCAGAGISTDQVALTETETWRGVAVGVNTQMNLAPRWKLEVDAAYLPYVDRAGVDNHWARADINPGPETGRGWGTQVEAVLSYAVNERLSLGVGGRYWYFTTLDGESQFPQAATASPLKYTAERYGGFVQASYKIGDVAPLAREDERGTVDWTGFYAGGHLGAGVGSYNWSDPYPTPVTGDKVKTGGALGGAQAGYNRQFGKFVLGAEVSGSFARIEGTETCFGGIMPASGAGMQCENKTGPMAIIAGRAGYAFDRSFVYGKVGAAVASESYTLNSQGLAGGTTSASTSTDWGWTVGAGLEHALTPRWSAGIEYNYVDFGSRTVSFAVPAALAAATPNNISSRVHLMTLRLNYHFDPLSRAN